MTRPAVKMEVGEDGVAVITMWNPPVNSISDQVMTGVVSSFEDAQRRKDVKAIVLTGADGKFCGGADIRNLQSKKAEDTKVFRPTMKTTWLNDIMEGSSKPAVAAIETFALGGGLEFAMACHARLAAPKTRLGLPELQLGIIPGLGGTQRLPRLVGVEKAIDMMLTGRFISAEEARQAGLVDAVVSAEQLIPEARKWALDIATGRKPWNKSLERTDHLGSVQDSLSIINAKRAQVKQISRNIPHPAACLDVVEEGIIKGGRAATFLEEKMCAELTVSPTAKSLIHAFFSERSVFKVPGVTDQGSKPRRMRSAAIVGGGLMGSGIATALVLQQIPVLLKETDASALNRGISAIKANLESRAKKDGVTQQKLQSTLALIKGTLDYKDFGDVDIVMEAAFESVPVKQQIFQDLEKYCKPDCILATNTSLIDINTVAAKTRCQDRVVGTHFFSPAHVMPLLELVRSDKTSPQVVLDLINLAKIIKKTPVVVKSSVGFAINRVFFPYFMSSDFLTIQLGIHPYRIDSILKDFGMPMGPYRLGDLAGHQIGAAARPQWRQAFPDRTYAFSIATILVENNRLGEKTRKGAYNYSPDSRKEQPAPELDQILAETRKLAGWKEYALSDEEVLEMVLFPVVNEACRVLEERVVLRTSDLDLATILGMGFPRYRGGVVFWGDSIGARYIYLQLSKWSTLHQFNSLGAFYKPCASLERAVATNSTLAKIVESAQARL